MSAETEIFAVADHSPSGVSWRIRFFADVPAPYIEPLAIGRLRLPSETLSKYVRQVEANEGLRPDLPTSAEREEIRELRREVFELRRANEILKAASVFFAGELDPHRPR